MAYYYDETPVIGRLDNFISSDKVSIRLNYGLKLHYLQYPEPCYMYKTGNANKTTAPFPTSFEIQAENVKRIGAYISTNHLPVTPETTFYKNPFELVIKWIDEEDVIDSKNFDRNIQCKNYIPDLFYADYERFTLVEWSDLYYNVPLGVGNIQAIEYIFEIGLPVFDNENDLDDYLQSGNEDKSINPSEPEYSSDKDRYIYCTGYSNTVMSKDSGAIELYNNRLDLHYSGRAKGWNATRPVAGWVKNSLTSNLYNIELIENDEIIYAKPCEEELDGDKHNYESLDDCLNPAWLYSTLINYNSLYYYGDLDTNIPIFDTREKAIEWLHGADIDPLNPKKDKDKNPTGEDVEETGYNDINGLSVGATTLVMNISECTTFWSLFVTGPQPVEQIVQALLFYGNNPADYIVDYFAIPFRPETVSDVLTTDGVRFGWDVFLQGNTFRYISKIAPKLVDCFSIYITGTFNDWRDYASNYYLFLPYLGMTQIDINKYMYTTMSCKVSVDVRTGQIKYHIYSDGIEMDTFETVCRVSMPTSTNNMYSNAREKLSAITNVVGSGVQIANGNFLAAGSLYEASLDLVKPPQVNVSGACSPSNAWLDPNICYLYIQTPDIKYNGITSGYNYPDNEFTTIGGHSGYLEATDVILSGCSDCSEHEKNIIKSLIKEGIIL